MGNKTNPFIVAELAFFVAATVLTSSSFAAQNKTYRPNILLIITDEGYGDLAVHGNPKLRTRVSRFSVVLRFTYAARRAQVS